MRLFLISFFLLFISGSSVAQPWALVWGDEFNYTGLPDPAKWSYDVGGSGWGNNELQYYTENRAENAKVEGGNLVIVARKESYGNSNYTSARLVSRGKGDWLYGRIEVRAKLPVGKGTWPAIWMLPTDWAYGNWPNSGEIDIMEHVGYDPGRVHGTVHTKAYNHSIGTQKGGNLVIPDAQSAFHNYAIEWNADTIMFFIDSQKYFMFTRGADWAEWPFDKRFHLLLNLAVGGNWGGAQGVDDTIFPATFLVDYVRVYKRLSNLNIVGKTYVKPNEKSLQYQIQVIENASYTWSVPADAKIVAGQGTNQIFVDWGQTEGKVMLEVSLNGNKYNSDLMVNTVVVPASDTLVVDNFDDAIPPVMYFNNAINNIVTATESNGSLLINYQVADKNVWPNVKIDFTDAFDLSNHEQMLVKVKTFNKSNSVVLRFDLIDTDDTETNGSKVFTLVQVNSDGNFHTYKYNFNESWVSNTPAYGKTVGKDRIKGVKIYLNYGFYGVNNASDSVWINDIAFTAYDASVGFSKQNTINEHYVYPNPFSDVLYINKPCAKCTVEMSDLAGRILFQSSQQNENLAINVPATLHNGIYILKLIDENQKIIHIQKIIHNK